MDSGDSKKGGPTTRSQRRASTQVAKGTTRDKKKGVAIDESENQDEASSKVNLVRQSIKRSREDDGASRAVNGSKEPKSLSKEDEDESPIKKQKLEEKRSGMNEKCDEKTDEVDMDTGENEDSDEAMNTDEESEQDQGSSLTAHPGTEDTHPAHAIKENQEYGVFSNRQSPIPLIIKVAEKPKTKTENYKPVTRSGDGLSVAAVSVNNRQLRQRINTNYQHPVSEKLKNPPSRMSQNSFLPSEPQKRYVYPIMIQTAYHENTELTRLQKPVPCKASPASSSSSSSKGWPWYKCVLLSVMLIVLLALVFACCFLAYQKFLPSYLPQTDVVHSKKVEKFDPELKSLQNLFRSQRLVFWKRSGKHIKHHLETLNPTEPVSVILTAGLQAERTLGCLARSLAAEYSAIYNASILEINGTTKRAQDSDLVKMEIDEELIQAFEGDKPAAVVHRFEELPPGSTLIFYRYCDHENAAYKKVFLVFTVMLSVEEIAPSTSLSEVEDMVYDHVKQKFVISDQSTMFNKMDVDKLSGLWSRISHLILPVAAEETIEQQGCGS